MISYLTYLQPVVTFHAEALYLIEGAGQVGLGLSWGDGYAHHRALLTRPRPSATPRPSSTAWCGIWEIASGKFRAFSDFCITMVLRHTSGPSVCCCVHCTMKAVNCSMRRAIQRLFSNTCAQ